MAKRAKQRSFGGSLALNGGIVGATLLANAAFMPGTSDFTISTWIFASSASVADAATHGFCMYAPSGLYANGFALSQFGNILYVYLKGTGGAPTLVTAGFFTDRANRWVHVTVAFDRKGNQIRVYADGELVNSGTNPGGPWDINESANFEAGAGTFSSLLAGSREARVRMWKGIAMTSAQVAALHYDDIDPASSLKVIDADFSEQTGTSMANRGTAGGSFIVTASGWSTDVPMSTRSLLPSQNLITFSEKVGDASWTKSNLSVVDDAATAPIGTRTADILVEDSALTFKQAIAPTTAAGSGSWVHSIYLKAVGRSWATVSTGAGGSHACFDLANGATGSITGTQISASDIEYVGNGWYRCCILSSHPWLQVFLANADGGIAYTGDGRQAVAVWGAQTIVSSVLRCPPYVPTTAVAVDTGAPRGRHPKQNLFAYSEDFSQASWSKQLLTPTSSGNTAPDGTATATAFVDSIDGVSSQHYIEQLLGGPAPDVGTVTVVSVYAKAGTKSVIGIAPNAAAVGYTFNLAAGTIGSPINSSPLAQGIEPVGGGWYRCWVAFAYSTPSVRIYAASSTASVLYQGAGNGTVLLWGAQASKTNTPAAYAKSTTMVVDSGTPRGVVASQNLLTRSNDLANVGAWPRVGLTSVVALGNVGPGGQPAFRLTDFAGAGGHYISQTVTGMVPGRVYTARVDVRAGTKTRMGIAPDGASAQVGFDLATLASQVNVNFLKSARGYAVALRDGWVRCFVTYQSDGYSDLRLYLQDVIGSVSYTADGLGTLDFCAPQLTETTGEAPYVPTDATAVNPGAPRGLMV